MKRPTVYILRCRNGRYYVGVTANPDRRLMEHAFDSSSYTARNGPCVLVWEHECGSMMEAIEVERRIKGWRRAKKEALIEGRWEDLPELAATARDGQGRRRPSTGSG